MGAYSNAVLQSRGQVVADAINSGSGPGVIQLLNAGGGVLVSIPFDDPCGTPVNDLLTFTGFPKTAAATAGGDIASGRIVNSAGVVVRSGMSVGLPGVTPYEITVDALAIAIAQNLTVLVADVVGR